jgi:hypothetical protein
MHLTIYTNANCNVKGIGRMITGIQMRSGGNVWKADMFGDGRDYNF